MSLYDIDGNVGKDLYLFFTTSFTIFNDHNMF